MTKKRLPQATARGKEKSLPPHVIPRRRKRNDGSVETYWMVRMLITVKGKPDRVERACKTGSATDAADVYRALELEFGNKTPRQLDNRNRTFGELADWYEENHLIPAVYTREGSREAGLARIDTPLRYLNGQAKLTEKQKNRCYGPDLGWRTLIGEKTLLADITGQMLAGLRKYIAKQPALRVKGKCKDGQKRGPKDVIATPRSVKDLNLRFGLLRSMFNVARKDLKWMEKWQYPFDDSSKSLIKVAQEPWRNRVMSDDEEEAILKFAVGPRAHLAVIIPGLVDTCMRATEFFQLKVRDWQGDVLRIHHMTTKTKRERRTTASERFEELMERWIVDNNLRPDDYLFNLKTIRAVCGDPEIDEDEGAKPIKSVRKAWNTCKRLTGDPGLQDLTIKDLRRTGATWLHRDGKSVASISSLLGHTDIKMTKRYIGFDEADLTDIRETQNQRQHRKVAARIETRLQAGGVN